MDSQSLDVLQRLLGWRRAGRRAVLVTVLDTYGTSPRPAGSLAAIRDDGALAGSISGGCVEEVLTRHLQARWAQPHALPPCECIRYGLDAEEQNRLRLPCGKQVRVCVEYQPDPRQIEQVLQALRLRMPVRRSLRYADGASSVQVLPPGPAGPALAADAQGHVHRVGPSHRLILIGANDVAAYIAPMALALDFQVTVCDPRESLRQIWATAGVTLDHRMPDDLIRDMGCDQATAVVAVSHDPRLDDLALMEALATPCFYVGVVGSRASGPKRRERLALLDVAPQQLRRLHSPAGLPIGSRTPAQIAVSVLAELVAQQQQSLPCPHGAVSLGRASAAGWGC